jgi:predicted outer membrane repeat protein
MSIIGESQKNTIINGQQSGKSIFKIGSGLNVTIANLTLTDGTSDNGGAIYNEGTLTVTNDTFNTNTAGNVGSGGAIYNDFSLTVNKSTFTGNYAQDGGAISSDDSLTVANSTFTNNFGLYGGVIWNFGDSTINNNIFTNNNGDYGGVIYNEHISTIFVINNTFTKNQAPNGAVIFNYGTSTETNNTFNNNTAGYGSGGAINNLGTSTETNNTFNNNSAWYGGAIANQGTSTETNNTFNNNSAWTGGAIANPGNLIVKNSNFINNTAHYGGAIFDDYTLNVTESNFTNNTATQGGAIYIDGSSGPVNVNFNRIVGNTPNSNELYAYNNRAVNATLNWWGLNTSPENEISGTSVTYTPWTVLTVTSNHSTINIGDNSTVTADLLHDNLGNYNDPVNGHVPDGIPANFTCDALGNINPISVTTLNGSSPTIFTGVSIGTSEVSATVDSQTVTTNIIIAKIPTTITVKPVNGYNSKIVNLTATLTDIYGNFIANKTITFSVNGHTYISSTNNNGLATVQYIPDRAGNYNVTANYLGNNNYAASQGTGLLNVNTSAYLYLQITTSKKNPKVGETFTLTYKLGNKGPDNATNVIINIPLQSDFIISSISGNDNWTYNPTNNILTWTLTTVPVGDPYLYITGTTNTIGIYVFGSSISSETYNSNTKGVDPITINVTENNTITPTKTANTVKDLTTTIPMQHTGLPFAGLILAILTVLSGSIMSRKK